MYDFSTAIKTITYIYLLVDNTMYCKSTTVAGTRIPVYSFMLLLNSQRTRNQIKLDEEKIGANAFCSAANTYK